MITVEGATPSFKKQIPSKLHGKWVRSRKCGGRVCARSVVLVRSLKMRNGKQTFFNALNSIMTCLENIFKCNNCMAFK